MHIVITGASSGIGRALSVEFVKRGEKNLYLISRSSDKLKIVADHCKNINSSCSVTFYPFDIDRLLVEDLPPEFKLPRVDILINNAALLRKEDFLVTKTNDIMDMLTTNFIAPACLIQKLSGIMGGEAPSHIVNIGSMAGYPGSRKFNGLGFYGASKAALASLTESLAVEMSGRNIFVNCLALGSVGTEMLATAFPGYKAPLTPEQMAEFIADFAIKGFRYFNGKVLPVALATP